MCRRYHFIVQCPEDNSVSWQADQEISISIPQCVCRRARRGQWGTCPNFDSHFAKAFRNDLDVRYMHCANCMRLMQRRLTKFVEDGGWREDDDRTKFEVDIETEEKAERNFERKMDVAAASAMIGGPRLSSPAVGSECPMLGGISGRLLYT